MSNTGQLKKEFAQKDVQRMRNIISGKTGDRTGIQSGYEKTRQEYKEGDIWEENGKQWTIKNNIKQTVTKFDKLKKLVSLPLTCPECKKHMPSTELNKKMYSIHNKCFDCVVEMETKLKIEGKYSEYEKSLLNANKNHMLIDLEQILDNWINETDSFVSEDGVVESWSKGKGNDEFYKNAKENIKILKEKEL
jgi:ribosomal protein L44E